MAPEIVRFEMHGLPVDIWALGCLLYEMLFGLCPFDHGGSTPIEIFKEALAFADGDAALLRFPWFYSWFSAQQRQTADLITSLLLPDPHVRPTALDVSKHAALADFPILEVREPTASRVTRRLTRCVGGCQRSYTHASQRSFTQRSFTPRSFTQGSQRSLRWTHDHPLPPLT